MWRNVLSKQRGQESNTLYGFSCNQQKVCKIHLLRHTDCSFIEKGEHQKIKTKHRKLTESHLISQYHMSLFGPRVT